MSIGHNKKGKANRSSLIELNAFHGKYFMENMLDSGGETVGFRINVNELQSIGCNPTFCSLSIGSYYVGHGGLQK